LHSSRQCAQPVRNCWASRSLGPQISLLFQLLVPFNFPRAMTAITNSKSLVEKVTRFVWFPCRFSVHAPFEISYQLTPVALLYTSFPYSTSARQLAPMPPSRNSKSISEGVKSLKDGFSRMSLGSRSDWLGALIETAKAMATAAEVGPFPYNKSAAGTVVVLLQNIEVSHSVCTVPAELSCPTCRVES